MDGVREFYDADFINWKPVPHCLAMATGIDCNCDYCVDRAKADLTYRFEQVVKEAQHQIVGQMEFAVTEHFAPAYLVFVRACVAGLN